MKTSGVGNLFQLCPVWFWNVLEFEEMFLVLERVSSLL